jgi:hypothetical protein
LGLPQLARAQPSALERRQALPTASSPVASEEHTSGTLWKSVRIAAVFASGFLVGHFFRGGPGTGGQTD